MINWDRIVELRDEVGEEDFAEIVELFLNEVDDVIDRLRTTQTRTITEADLHFLKGSALNLGFRDLSSLCQEGERHITQGSGGGPDLGQFVDSYQRSRAAFLETKDIRTHH